MIADITWSLSHQTSIYCWDMQSALIASLLVMDLLSLRSAYKGAITDASHMDGFRNSHRAAGPDIGMLTPIQNFRAWDGPRRT